MSVDRTAEELLEALSPKKKPAAYDTAATVTRVEGDILWVHIPGGVDETPVQRTVGASPGDVIQIRVGGGRAWAVGNATAPPTDDTVARSALQALTMETDERVQAVREEAEIRAAAIKALAAAMEAEGGMHITTESATGGGTIYYIHDHAIVAESAVVIKLTAAGLGISVDGGTTWSSGYDFATETAVVNILAANGINADWINAGALTVTDSNGHILFKADTENNQVKVGGLLAGYGLIADYSDFFSLRGDTIINLVDGTNAARVEYGPDEINFYLDEQLTEDEATNLVGFISVGNSIHLDPGLSGFTIGSGDAVYIRVPTARDFVVESDPERGIYSMRRPLTEIGTLSSLTTSAKSSLVAAINEVIADLTPTISNNTGDTVSVATGATTNIMSVTLTPGKYLLIGTATFQANSTGYRSLGFAKSASSATEDRFAQATVAAGSGFAPRVQVMTAWNITTTTTVYLNAVQTSGSTLSVTAPGIQAIRLQDLS